MQWLIGSCRLHDSVPSGLIRLGRLDVRSGDVGSCTVAFCLLAWSMALSGDVRSSGVRWTGVGFSRVAHASVSSGLVGWGRVCSRAVRCSVRGVRRCWLMCRVLMSRFVRCAGVWPAVVLWRGACWGAVRFGLVSLAPVGCGCRMSGVGSGRVASRRVWHCGVAWGKVGFA
jgi:hypothetical protein